MSVTNDFINPYKLFVGSYIPNWLLERTEVSPGAKLTYARLSRYAGERGIAFPRMKRLAAEIGCSYSAVRKYIEELKRLPLIVSQPRRSQLGDVESNEYRFLRHAWMDRPLPAEEQTLCPPGTGGLPAEEQTPARRVAGIEEVSQLIESEKIVTEELFPRSQNQNSGPAVDEWAESPWLRQFLQQQTAINGDKLPRLMNYEFWADLSEAVNGLDLPLLTREFAKMGLWLRDNPARAPTPKGIRRFVAGWFERAYERERRIPNGNSQAAQGQRRYHQPGR